MPDPHVVVVGAGVVGLSVAIRLAEAGHQVEVRAREMPLETTSAIAAAIWYPYRIDPPDRALLWAGRSLAEFDSLSDDPATGVVRRYGIELMRESQPDPWWSSLVPDLERLDFAPEPYRDGWSFVAPVIEMPIYLDYLRARFESLGGALTRVALSSLPDDAPVVVNCSGLGARRLLGDSTMVPVRGQVLLMSQVGLESWVLDGDGLTYVVPRSHDIVIGGTDSEGQWDTSPDPLAAAQMLGRATNLVPELGTADVLGHRVGLRPGRPVVRLEVERLADDRRIVHCYGHGGAGVTVSWGCADEVVSLLEREASVV